MKKIIACIDGSIMSAVVGDASVWVAKKLKAPLTLLNVLDKSKYETKSELSGTIGFGANEQLLAELTNADEIRSKLALKYGKQLLDDALIKANKQDLIDVSKQQIHGDLISSLLDLEPETRLVIIAKSSKNHQENKHILGSQLESVIRSIKAHILVITESFKQPENYMVAFDGSKISQKLIFKVIQTPLTKGLKCHLVMVGREHEDAFKLAAKKLRAANVDVQESIVIGEVDTALLEYQRANQIDLIAMGAYGQSRFMEFFLGSNTMKILKKNPVPLLLIR